MKIVQKTIIQFDHFIFIVNAVDNQNLNQNTGSQQSYDTYAAIKFSQLPELQLVADADNFCMKAQLEQGNARQVDFLINFTHSNQHKDKDRTAKSEPKEFQARPILRQHTQIIKNTFYQLTKWQNKRTSHSVRSSCGNRSYSKDSDQAGRDLVRQERNQVINCIRNEIYQKNRKGIHDSFSNYLIKKQKIFKNGFSAIVITKTDEMANKIASSKKIQKKIELDDRKLQDKRKKSRHFGNMHFLTKDGQEMKIRYKQFQEGQRQYSQIERQSPSHFKSKSNRNSPFFKKIRQTKQAEHINPWGQNQQEFQPYHNRSTKPYLINNNRNYPNLQQILQ